LLPAPKIDVPPRMQADAGVDAAAEEQGDHYERAVEPIGHQDVARLEGTQQGSNHPVVDGMRPATGC